MLYFAYGSNLNLDQMADRCPGAEQVGPGMLYHWRLAFRGPLDIERASGRVVPGFVFDVTDETDWQALDAYEGYPHLYDRMKLPIAMSSGREVQAIAYVMVPRVKRKGRAAPGYGYLATVRRGYEHCGLVEHREMLEQALKAAL